MRTAPDSIQALAEKLAKDSIVTQALERYLIQVLTEVHESHVQPLRDCLRLIIAEPYGCPFCDSGKLRNPEKSHDKSCGFAKAAEILAS